MKMTRKRPIKSLLKYVESKKPRSGEANILSVFSRGLGLGDGIGFLILTYLLNCRGCVSDIASLRRVCWTFFRVVTQYMIVQLNINFAPHLNNGMLDSQAKHGVFSPIRVADLRKCGKMWKIHKTIARSNDDLIIIMLDSTGLCRMDYIQHSPSRITNGKPFKLAKTLDKVKFLELSRRYMLVADKIIDLQTCSKVITLDHSVESAHLWYSTGFVIGFVVYSKTSRQFVGYALHISSPTWDYPPFMHPDLISIEQLFGFDTSDDFIGHGTVVISVQERVINQVFRLISHTRRTPHLILIQEFIYQNDDLTDSGFEWMDRNIHSEEGTQVIGFNAFPNTGLNMSCINYPSGSPILYYTPIRDKRSNDFFEIKSFVVEPEVADGRAVWIESIHGGQKHEIIICLSISNAKWLHFYRVRDYCHLIKRIKLSNYDFPQSIRPVFLTSGVNAQWRTNAAYNCQHYPLFEGDYLVSSYILEFKGRQQNDCLLQWEKTIFYKDEKWTSNEGMDEGFHWPVVPPTALPEDNIVRWSEETITKIIMSDDKKTKMIDFGGKMKMFQNHSFKTISIIPYSYRYTRDLRDHFPEKVVVITSKMCGKSKQFQYKKLTLNQLPANMPMSNSVLSDIQAEYL